MDFPSAILQAVEALDYRVTAGDVASRAGLEINFVQSSLLALAASADGHIQVADSGEIVYVFPRNLRDLLRNKYIWIRLKEFADRIWRVIFYLIRMSFGIMLMVSILLVIAAIVVIIFAASNSRDSDSSDSGEFSMPSIWFNPFDIFWLFDPGYTYYGDNFSGSERTGEVQESEMNFLIAVFSFIFGDGNPNRGLEERRWQMIGQVIASHHGVVIAEQIAPYVDEVDEDEDYMLPVLVKFNGFPHVSPDGEIVYQFPDLQATARQVQDVSVPAYLRENPWKFSEASTSQLLWAGGLGVFNLSAALVLGVLLRGGLAAGGFIGFVGSIYWLLLAYGLGFLVIPAVRYFWLRWRNDKIANRNWRRQDAAVRLNEGGLDLERKLRFAGQFAFQTVITEENLAYTTETDLLDQEISDREKLDREWQMKLEQAQGEEHPRDKEL